MKKEKVKTNNKKIEKEKKLVQDIISKYSETFKALGDYDKKEPSIISKARCTDDK